MLEVTARLPGRCVFLAGEPMECKITFTNTVRKKKDGSPAKTKTAKLAWASAQIHCQCTTSESRVILPQTSQLTTADVSSTATETSFVPSRGEKGSTVLATRPIILFCDLALAPGESQTFTYRETVPLEAPPSFRGTAIKYSYKVTIGTQRFHHPTKLLRVPFRVLVVPGMNDLSVYTNEEDVKPNNPFSERRKKQHSLLEIALEVLQTITCRKGPNFYNITNSHGKVARFCMFKQAYRIGDDIIATCDFSESNVPCVQYSVTLQSEEIISETCRKKSSQGTTVNNYCKHHEFCLHTKKTHISLPVPLTATPGFVTDVVSLKWRLHFEFVTSKKPLPLPAEPATNSESVQWQGPTQLEVETMVWDLPIKIFATNPFYASSVSLLKNEHSCFL